MSEAHALRLAYESQAHRILEKAMSKPTPAWKQRLLDAPPAVIEGEVHGFIIRCGEEVNDVCEECWHGMEDIGESKYWDTIGSYFVGEPTAERVTCFACSRVIVDPEEAPLRVTLSPWPRTDLD